VTAPVIRTRRARPGGLAAQDERLTRRVGAMGLVVLVGAFAFALFVAPRIEWGERVHVRVYFHDTGGLREGAAVVVGGRAIGRIEAIGPALHGAPGPLGGEVGVAVTASIAADAAWLVPRDGDFFIASRGPLSERYLEIGSARAVRPVSGVATAPAASAVATDGNGRPIADGDEVLGRDPPTLDRVLERTWTNLTISREFGRAIRPEYDALRAQLSRLAETLLGLVVDAADAGVADLGGDLAALRAEARALREVGLGGDAGLARLDAVMDGTRALIARVRGTIDALDPMAGDASSGARALRDRLAARGPAVIERFALAIERGRAAMDRVEPLLARIGELRALIARGEGSLGRIMTDPEFPEDAKELGKIMKRQPWKIIDRPQD
jgi:phospholipid/cholesterol/gamma-HCH transport system substrate-binding protein